MPESDERSGLAKSIDALFSQPRRSAPAEEPEGEGQETPPPAGATPPPLPSEATEPPLPAESTPPPLPTEAAPPPLPEASPPPPMAEVPTEPEPFAPLDAPPPEPEVEPPAEAPATSAPETSAPEPPPPAPKLTEAVDAFLAGHPGAAAKVERIAAELRERMALDPLADAVERLVHAADDAGDDPAIELARKITNPAVASRLVQRMSHEEDEIARASYIGLSQRLGMVMANAFKGALTDATDKPTRRACYDGLIALGDTSRPVIEAMVEDDNRFLVQNAVAILGEVGGDRALELVTSALANTDPRVRREALSSLAKLGTEESGQLVLASLEDPNEKVRAAAAEAAGRLRVQRALRPMLALLDDDDLEDDELIQVLRGLGALGDPGAVQAIEKRAVGSLFSKPPTEVRVAAYRALHEIGTPHAREVIVKAAEDKDPVVRTTVKGFAQDD